MTKLRYQANYKSSFLEKSFKDVSECKCCRNGNMIVEMLSKCCRNGNMIVEMLSKCCRNGNMIVESLLRGCVFFRKVKACENRRIFKGTYNIFEMGGRRFLQRNLLATEWPLLHHFFQHCAN